MGQQDEWNNFLDEVEGKENNTCCPSVGIGNVLPNSFTLQHVTHPSNTTVADDDSVSSAKTLEDILRASHQNATLFVFNRHFA